MTKKQKIPTVFLIILGLSTLSGCINQNQQNTINPDDYRTIIDMRGMQVQVPKNISRVVDISDGLVTSIMYNLGIANKVVGLGSTNLQEIDTYEYQDSTTGQDYSYTQGMNPISYLLPNIQDLPAVAEYGMAVNFESIAALQPDVIIIEVGFCSMSTDEGFSDEEIQQNIATIESLGIPTVVLYGSPALNEPNVSMISQEIITVGDVFNRTTDATQLAHYLEYIIQDIQNRTKNITEPEKPRVLLFGLSYVARESGGNGAGDVLCTDTIESFFIENIVNAKNAYQEIGGWKILNAEQILAINPDVIILPTDWGYHPPRELYTADYYKNLRELDAIKNRRVWALPWTPYNCAKRLEYPIEAMIIAKASYPNLFSDITIHSWVLDFYQQVYHVDNQTAQQLRTIQWLNWTVEENV